MEIVNVRIDERLIHGQIAAVWSKTTGANRIMVIDGHAAKDSLQKTALKMACPSQCKLSVLSVGTAVKNLLSGKYQDEKIFIIVKSPSTLHEVYDEGYHFTKVNVGNMAKKAGSRRVKETVYVTQEDESNFNYLNNKGVRFTAQMVPKEEAADFMKLLEKVR